MVLLVELHMHGFAWASEFLNSAREFTIVMIYFYSINHLVAFWIDQFKIYYVDSHLKMIEMKLVMDEEDDKNSTL